MDGRGKRRGSVRGDLLFLGDGLMGGIVIGVWIG